MGVYMDVQVFELVQGACESKHALVGACDADRAGCDILDT